LNLRRTLPWKLFQYDKLNYLMLMMVDPDVHFHVLPRYEGDRSYGGLDFSDATWPGPPDISHANEFPDALKAQLIADLKAQLG
jgi:diadenosine tetraphosphate (Ap4A) HIT family hydrolase